MTVEGELIAEIGPGLLVLLGVTHSDTTADADRLAQKTRALRIFSDADGRMNEPLESARCSPSASSPCTATRAAVTGPPGVRPPPEPSPSRLYERFCETLGAQRGVFGADMAVALINDGPVTLLLDT